MSFFHKLATFVSATQPFCRRHIPPHPPTFSFFFNGITLSRLSESTNQIFRPLLIHFPRSEGPSVRGSASSSSSNYIQMRTVCSRPCGLAALKGRKAASRGCRRGGGGVGEGGRGERARGEGSLNAFELGVVFSAFQT